MDNLILCLPQLGKSTTDPMQEEEQCGCGQQGARERHEGHHLVDRQRGAQRGRYVSRMVASKGQVLWRKAGRQMARASYVAPEGA